MSENTIEELRAKLKVKSPKDYSEQLKLLFMGEPGAGKTLLAGSLVDVPDLLPALYLDVDGGFVTNRRAPVGTIDPKPIDSIQQLEQIWKLLDTNRGLYKTVVIDSLSELQKKDMKAIMKAAKARHPDTVDEEVPSQREYLKSQVHMRDIVREYRDLGLHVIFITHSKVEDKSGRVKILPQLPGQQAADIAGFLSMVGLLEVERIRVKGEDNKTETRIVRTLTTQQDGISVVKDRYQVMPDKMMNPTMAKIWKLIKDDNEKDG